MKSLRVILLAFIYLLFGSPSLFAQSNDDLKTINSTFPVNRNKEAVRLATTARGIWDPAGKIALNAATGTIVVNDAVRLAANIGITGTAGTGAIDYSMLTGLFKTPTGAATFGGSANTFTNAVTFSSSATSTSPTAGIGYAAGAGGAVTQATSRTTGVTLNKVTGAITLVSAAGSATASTFTLTNSTIAATDVVHVTQKSGTDKYVILVTATAAGSCNITFYTTGGTTTEQPIFNFAVIKGASN